MNLPWLSVVAGTCAGVAVHQGIFIHGEWHVQAPALIVTHSCCTAALLLGNYLIQQPNTRILTCLLLANLAYYVGIALSVVIYRNNFHPLTKANIPGPPLARITKLWHVYQARHSTNHLVLERLRQQYGDFVRTGPSEITVFCPEIFWVIDGPKSTCIKSEWYDILHPNLALVTARNKSVHGTRRRQWSQGFTTKALELHEEKIVKYVDQLDACIEGDAVKKNVSNIRDYLFWFGFDVMGDFVFNKSFGMLENRRWHFLIVRLQRALSLLGPFSPAPWIIQAGFRLAPRISILKDWFDMVAWCESQMWERIKGSQLDDFKPDLTHYLMEKAGTHCVGEENWFWMKGDSLLAIVAGSEPTAAALVGVFCELAKNPQYIEQILDEITKAGVGNVHALAEAECLNAVINESLRIYPALLTGGARKTTEATTIGGKVIPAHTTIVAPRFSISRRDDCFVRPNDFLPQRWYQGSELLLNKAAFAPFGTGSHSCLGRNFAIDTMRLVVARVVSKYRFGLAPGETGLRVAQDVKDQFTSNPGPLELAFQLR